MTWPVTLVSRPDLMEQWTVHPDVFDPADPGTQVWAPCCGRRTPAFTIVSLEGLNTEIRGGNIRPKQNLDWACDGCLHLLVLDESSGWTWSKLYRALGAPPEIIRYYRAKEMVREQELQIADAVVQTVGATVATLGADTPVIETGINPQTAFEEAYNSLPDSVDVPGTEPPNA